MESDGTLLDIRAAVEKLEAGNEGVVNKFVGNLELCRSDRALEIVGEDSTGRRSCEDCSHYHGVPRDDPCWRAKREKARFGVDQTFNEPSYWVRPSGICLMQLCVEERRVEAYGSAGEEQGRAEMHTTCGYTLLDCQVRSKESHLRICKHRVYMKPVGIQSGDTLLQ